MNQNKTISANSKGITISFGDVNKHQFIYYNNNNDVVKSIQRKGTVKYQELEKTDFNKVQQQLYNQAVYGLKSFPNQVIMEMKTERIRTVQAIHTRAKHVINNYKQEIASNRVDNFLSKMFPNSPIVKQMLNIKGVDPAIKIPTSLRDLKITPTMLAKKLVEFKVLPENFFNLA